MSNYSYDRRKTAGTRLDPSLKRQVNAALEREGFGGKRKFRKMGEALNAAMGVLSEHGLEQDEVVSADRFREPSGHATVRVAYSNPSDPFSPETVSNSVLALQWTELRPGVLEVIAYMS